MEAWPENNESYYLENPPNKPCKQGRTSLYSAIVESTLDIQKVVLCKAAQPLTCG